MKRGIIILACILVSAFSCKEDELGFSFEPSVGFQKVGGVVAVTNTTGIKVDLYFNTPPKEEGSIKVKLVSLNYGTVVTTEPAAINNEITLTFDADGTAPSFYVYPNPAAKAPNYASFQLVEVTGGGGIQLGQNSALQFNLVIDRDYERLTYSAFEDCNTDPVGFTEQNVTSAIQANIWVCTTFGFPQDNSKAAEANAFGKGTGAFNSYLILPPINATEYESIRVSMQVYSRFSSTGDDALKVRYSTNYSGTGNPEAAGVTWTDLTDLNSQMPAEGSRVWKEVIGFFNAPNAPFYLAIQYKGSTTPTTANYRIDEFEVKGK